MVLRILERYTQKIKLNQPLTIYKRINSKCIKDLNVRLETVKTQEENLGSKISYISYGNSFSKIPPQTIETKEKINKWGYIKLKSFCREKQTINKMKRQCIKW